jgi:hypothetical protein
VRRLTVQSCRFRAGHVTTACGARPPCACRAARPSPPRCGARAAPATTAERAPALPPRSNCWRGQRGDPPHREGWKQGGQNRAAVASPVCLRVSPCAACPPAPSLTSARALARIHPPASHNSSSEAAPQTATRV